MHRLWSGWGWGPWGHGGNWLRDLYRGGSEKSAVKFGTRPAKFARVVFPEGWTMDAIRDTLARFPESDGYRCDLREVGPQGFSVPWTGSTVGAA